MSNAKGKNFVEATVPGQRLGWLKSELDAAGVPYQIERAGDGYHVHTHAQAAPVVDGVLGYKAKGQRKPPLLQRMKAFAQELIYSLEVIVVFIAVIAALLIGVKLFGLGHLDPSFSLLYQEFGIDSIIYPIRAMGLLFLAIALLFILNKTVGKPPGGMPGGHGTARFLDVLLIGGLVIALLIAWAGK